MSIQLWDAMAASRNVNRLSDSGNSVMQLKDFHPANHMSRSLDQQTPRLTEQEISQRLTLVQASETLLQRSCDEGRVVSRGS